MKASLDLQSAAEQRADVLRALAHPVRLLLLRELLREEECVCHLAHVLGKPQPYVSKQLAALRESKVVVDRRDGQRIFYRLASAEIASLLAAAWGKEGTIPPGHHARTGCPCPKCN